MKKILPILLFALCSKVYAQLDYQLTYSNSTYTELSGATDISSAAWNGVHTMALPFQFTYFGNVYNNIYVTYDGFFFSDTGDDYLFYGTDNFMPEDGNTSMSPISYSMSGNSPNRILKVQYKNVRDADIDTSSYEYVLNVQMWLYENGNKIEYHFGNTSITDPGYNLNYIGIIDYDNSPYLAIDSSAASPVLVRVLNAGTFDGIPSYPVNGQVYTLSPNNQNQIAIQEKPYQFKQIYNGFEFVSEASFKVELSDMNGRLIQVVPSLENGRTVYQAQGLSAGIYIVQIQIGNQNFSEKLVIR